MPRISWFLFTRVWIFLKLVYAANGRRSDTSYATDGWCKPVSHWELNGMYIVWANDVQTLSCENSGQCSSDWPLRRCKALCKAALKICGISRRSKSEISFECVWKKLRGSCTPRCLNNNGVLLACGKIFYNPLPDSTKMSETMFDSTKMPETTFDSTKMPETTFDSTKMPETTFEMVRSSTSSSTLKSSQITRSNFVTYLDYVTRSDVVTPSGYMTQKTSVTHLGHTTRNATVTHPRITKLQWKKYAVIGAASSGAIALVATVTLQKVKPFKAKAHLHPSARVTNSANDYSTKLETDDLEPAHGSSCSALDAKGDRPTTLTQRSTLEAALVSSATLGAATSVLWSNDSPVSTDSSSTGPHWHGYHSSTTTIRPGAETTRLERTLKTQFPTTSSITSDSDETYSSTHETAMESPVWCHSVDSATPQTTRNRLQRVTEDVENLG